MYKQIVELLKKYDAAYQKLQEALTAQNICFYTNRATRLPEYTEWQKARAEWLEFIK